MTAKKKGIIFNHFYHATLKHRSYFLYEGWYSNKFSSFLVYQNQLVLLFTIEQSLLAVHRGNVFLNSLSFLEFFFCLSARVTHLNTISDKPTATMGKKNYFVNPNCLSVFTIVFGFLILWNREEFCLSEHICMKLAKMKF